MADGFPSGTAAAANRKRQLNAVLRLKPLHYQHHFEFLDCLQGVRCVSRHRDHFAGFQVD